ncbi:UPF0075-domain-containing protein [Saitoella complicata NRRL Y-17804]|uniref:Anhydro-N-acetylmuramic acid kinase n=1 Tax=Saitoella complicata (strain BCRC 22490 / CBS 7301 / JCM 7358 / NBRC 10748 / NRRL Y-17804) TaxID=698492 RepID=A0A0E9NR84_SAICN|nr:UPF0075-domain-containing protein [Saitoella complicata NRRL Y-17804]ODQ54690.1 UPF0075-domain-containing protein [Saitoella complicata NRRL Y-17804]GAO51920.1 hypothetical protein G7K_6008-t1 [Saitoella complicata NRRL Y-17804]
MTLNIIGLNCGTSVDAIDIAYCAITPILSSPNDLRLELLDYTEHPVPPELKARVLKACRENAVTMEEICDLNFALGREFGLAAKSFIDRNGLEGKVDAIASHGQTLWHIPSPAPPQQKSTLQMAESAVIAQITGLTTISSFRVGDVAAGRMGAPLIAFLDAAVLAHPTLTRASQNLGGIGNVTIIPAGDSAIESCFEFDTGPGNVLIDAAVRIITNGEQEYDKDGLIGAQGRVYEDVVDEFLAHPYFSAALPKTTGRELFGDDIASQLVSSLRSVGATDPDVIATITRITAESLVRAYERYLQPGGTIDEVYLCGGGAYNPNITSYLSTHLPHTSINLFSTTQIAPEAKEAISFALLGHECLMGKSIVVPQHVESAERVVLGKITPGMGYGRLMRKVVGSIGFVSENMEDERNGLPYARRMEVVS